MKASFAPRSMIAAAILLVGCYSSLAADAFKCDPIMVLDGRQIAENTHNLDAALAFFADDASVRINVGIPATPDGIPFIGKESVRRFLDSIINQQNIQVTEASPRMVSGDLVTWRSNLWRDEWRAAGIAPVEYWGEARIVNCRIQTLRNGPTEESLRKLKAVAERAKQ